jgi:hypothetical protein
VRTPAAVTTGAAIATITAGAAAIAVAASATAAPVSHEAEICCRGSSCQGGGQDDSVHVVFSLLVGYSRSPGRMGFRVKLFKLASDVLRVELELTIKTGSAFVKEKLGDFYKMNRLYRVG